MSEGRDRCRTDETCRHMPLPTGRTDCRTDQEGRDCPWMTICTAFGINESAHVVMPYRYRRALSYRCTVLSPCHPTMYPIPPGDLWCVHVAALGSIIHNYDASCRLHAGARVMVAKTCADRCHFPMMSVFCAGDCETARMYLYPAKACASQCKDRQGAAAVASIKSAMRASGTAGLVFRRLKGTKSPPRNCSCETQYVSGIPRQDRKTAQVTMYVSLSLT
jgi:hypothetical protein